MMDKSLIQLSLADASKLIQDGALSPITYTETFLSHIASLDCELHAFISVAGDIAMADAHRAADEIAEGHWRGPLHGIPYGLKDIIDYGGQVTTAHSKLLQENVAEKDAHVTTRLKASGAVYMGKLATYEFACGGASHDLPWPVPLNPWNRDYITGGSSTGSAVAVASRMVPFALGTDTNGSIRNPCGRCGLVGMKPTYGQVSRSGIIPLAQSMDHVGPMTRTVRDNALVLNAIAGQDLAKQTGQPSRSSFDARIGQPIKGMHIGVARHVHLEDEQADPEQVVALETAIEMLRAEGAIIIETRLPKLESWNSLARLLMGAEGYAVHERWLREKPEYYGAGARSRLLQGMFLSSTDLLHAQYYRRRVATELALIVDGFDAFICASSTDATPRIDDDAAFAASYSHQVRMPFNLSGHPALAVPAGFSSQGLPMSLQIVGKHFDEAALYQVAYAYENLTQWHLRSPM